MNALDLSAVQRIHVVGIGGAGMSAIAAVLKAMGKEVTGSDLKESPALERLRSLGVSVVVGHDPSNLGLSEAVSTSTAVPKTNVEVRAANLRSIPVHTRAETLAAIVAQRRTVAVAGTHGKTTTASMLSLILVEAGVEPSFVIGGELNDTGTNAAWGAGSWMVVEADESDGTFLHLSSEVAVVTSIEPDHLDHYGSFSALRAAFGDFLSGPGRTAIVSADDPIIAEIAPAGATRYGTASDADVRIEGFGGGRSDISFRLVVEGVDSGEFVLPVPGLHNARNAAGAVAAAVRVGVDPADARRALARFAGVARRFEFRGERNGVSFVDDYAHLPGEVSAALAAARRGGWGRIVCVFQPHRFSRVASLAGSFAECFTDADLLVLTDVYPAGEAALPGVSGRLILDAVLDAHPETRAAYFPRRAELHRHLVSMLRPGDCCLTLGAGDLTSLPDELLESALW